MALDRRELLLLVDAGASHTRAVVATPSGNVLGLGEAGGGNPFASGERAAGAHLLRALRRALADARRPPSSISLAAVGSAGVGCDGTGRRRTERLLRRLLRGARLLVEADVSAALRAALAGAPGAVVVAGTGAIVLGRTATGRWATAGGWGWLFGDEGSGQWLGRQAIAAAARATDGSGPATRLAALLLHQTRSSSLWHLVQKAYRERWTPADYGALAPLVTRAAGGGDHVARALVDIAMRRLAAQIGAVVAQLRLRQPAVSYQGSVFAAGRIVLDPLRRALRRGQLVAPALPPLAGSLWLALESRGVAPAEAAANFVRQLPPELRGLGHA